MLTRDSHVLGGTEAPYYADIRMLLQKSRSSKRLYSYRTNLGTEETFPVKRSSGNNYKREVYSKANAKNTKR